MKKYLHILFNIREAIAKDKKENDSRVSGVHDLCVTSRRSRVRFYAGPRDNLFKSRPSGFRLSKCNAIVILTCGSARSPYLHLHACGPRARRVPRTINRSAVSLKDCYFVACNRI